MRKLYYFFAIIVVITAVLGTKLTASANAERFAFVDQITEYFGLQSSAEPVFSSVEAASQSFVPIPVSIPNLTASTGSVITVPIVTGDVTGAGAISYDLQVTYDPTVLQPASPVFDRAGTLSSSMLVTPNTMFSGHVIITAFQAGVLSGSGTLLNLKFNVIGAPGQSSPLALESFIDAGSMPHPAFRYNEGDPAVTTTSGSFTIPASTPTATSTTTPTNTATRTATATSTATFTPTFTPTFTATSTFTPTPTATNTFTPTPTSTSTFTPTSTATFTSTPTATNTFTPTPTSTSTFTPTATATFTPTNTATSTPTDAATDTPTETPAITGTATNTPTASGTPSLGNYSNVSIPLSTNTTVTPDVPPSSTVSMNVSTSTNFKGTLEGDPSTGIVRITDAHPAGTYPITVTAFGTEGSIDMRTFSLTVTTPAVCNAVSFAPAVNIGSSDGLGSLAIGDFNGDGKQDIAKASEISDAITIMLGNGIGSFSSSVNYAVGSQPRSVAVADFNGDGKQDLAAANQNSHDVSILLGDGIGGFGSATNFIAGSLPLYLTVNDFNGDGRQDLAISNANSFNVSVLLGDGTGGFSSPMNFNVGGYLRSIDFGDFNNDGNVDLAVAVFNPQFFSGVSIHLGNGDGSFGVGTIYAAANTDTASGITIGDFNGDGKQDVATANLSSNNVSVFLGNGAGTLSAAVNFNVGNGPYSLVTGDFNGDGNLDIVTTNYGGQDVSALLGDGLGNFGTAINFGIGNNGSHSIVVGDFNGDGKQDLATADGNPNNVSILLRDCAVGGTVTYGNALGNPTTRFVSNVQVNAAGSPPASTVTGGLGQGAGTYSLSLLGNGPYTVTASKSGGVNNAINSFDAARVAAHAAGTALLTGNALVAADVSGDGIVRSFDSAQIARYVTGLSGVGATGSWKFFTVPNIPFPIGSTPTSRTYSSLTNSLTGQDFTGILMGEVSGNWTNNGSRPGTNRGDGGQWTMDDRGPVRGITIEAPSVMADAAKQITVPVRVDGAADKGIISYEFNLRYDPSVLQPLRDVIDVAGTASRGLTAVANTSEPGLLRVAVYGAMPIDANAILFNLRFAAVGSKGSVSPLTWERIMFNDGEPQASAINGQIVITKN